MCGGAVSLASFNWLAGVIAAVLGGALGGGAGFMYDRQKEDNEWRRRPDLPLT